MARQNEGTWTANLLTKLAALVDIFVFAGHPGVYLNLWQERRWAFGISVVIVAPLALYWAVSVLSWRVRVDPKRIRFISLRGVFDRPIAEITEAVMHKGNLVVRFRDGKARTVPLYVQNLNNLLAHIENYRQTQPHGL